MKSSSRRFFKPTTVLHALISSTNWIVLLIVLAAVVFVGLSAYTNYYQVIISPKAISESDITARQQKVNIPLLEVIVASYTSKVSAPPVTYTGTRTPFSP